MIHGLLKRLLLCQRHHWATVTKIGERLFARTVQVQVRDVSMAETLSIAVQAKVEPMEVTCGPQQLVPLRTMSHSASTTDSTGDVRSLMGVNGLDSIPPLFFIYVMQELRRAREIIDDISGQTDSVILFHSLSGKDSIVLLDLLYGKFKRIVCVFMYLVKDLEHIMCYYSFAKNKYPNIEFVQVPHYALFNYIKNGYMGIAQNPRQRQWTLADITDKLRDKLGIEWACYGFKQSDSLNRRLMLRSYSDGKEAINYKSKKFYPLSTYKNGEVLDYIQDHRLKNPEVCGTNKQSSGVDIMDVEYMRFLSERFPSDLDKIYKVFPMARMTLMKENKNNEENEKRK